MTIKKDVVYPIFLECCQYTNDIFWENVFEDLAYGRTPYGTYISKGFLCCNYKKKEFSYKIEEKDSFLLYNEVTDILKRKLGLLSNKEKLKKKNDAIKMEEDDKYSEKNWVDISKKTTKSLLLDIYVINMRKKYNLEIEQSRKLLSMITFAIILKSITPDDIIYENGHISEIKGISFSNGKYTFDKNIYENINVSTPNIVFDEKKMMSENWDKYLKELRKKN